MRYLTLAADYLEPALIDQGVDFSSVDTIGLSAALAEEVRSWNASYQSIISMSLEQRAAHTHEMQLLDAAGLALAARIESELSPAKVRYYSEGFSQYVD